MSKHVDSEIGVRRFAGIDGRSTVVLATIFPPANERDHRRRESYYALGVAAAVGFLMVARAPFKFDQFWAEDGTVFLGSAINHGRLASLDEWYSGYLHTIPRLLGGLAASLPLRGAPSVFFVGVVLMAAAGSGLVMYRSSAYINRWWIRVLLACVPAILPTEGVEVIGNAANLQFLLVYFAFWLLLWFPRSRLTTVLATISAGLIALSTLLVVFLVPLAVARLFVRRGRRALVPPVALLAGVAVQVVGRVLVGAQRSDLGMEPVGIAGALDAFNGMVAANLRPPLPEPTIDLVSAVLVAVSVASVLVTTFAPKPGTGRSPDGPAVGRTMAGLCLAMGLGIWFTLALAVGIATRYGVLASFFLAAGLLVAVDVALDAHPTLVARIPACVLLVAFALSAFRGWQPAAWHDEVDRSWSQAVTDAQASCSATGAEWAQLPLSPRPWSVFLACDGLLDEQ